MTNLWWKTVEVTTLTVLIAACGDSAGRDESASGASASTSRGTDSTGATAPTEGNDSVSDSMTQSTEGGGSASDSQASATASATDSNTSGSSGTTQAASASNGSSTTSIGDDTTADSDGSGSSTEPPPPLVCGMPPKGFMGPDDPTCENAPKLGNFDPIVEWKKETWVINPNSRNVMMAPIVVSLTDDNADGTIDDKDVPDILLVTADSGQNAPGTLRALSGDGTKEHWSRVQEVAGTSGLAAGDLDGDGMVEIVAVTSDFKIRAFEHDGTPKWMNPTPFGPDMNNEIFAAPAIGDMDADGKPEIIVGRVILNHDGTLRGKGVHGTGCALYGSASFPADLDGDGVQEVVVGNALYKPDGSAIWFNNQPDGYPGVADFTGDGKPEIVVVGFGTVRLQDAAGKVLWSVINSAQAGGPPTIADFTGDGVPEIGVAGKTAYTVFKSDGSILWQKSTQDASSAITGSSVYDFEGDGISEIVYADETNLYVYNATNGALKLNFAEHSNATVIEYPLVADLDGDNEAEILVVHWNAFGPETGLTVIGDKDKSWRPGRKVWNQHAYSITNVNDDGSIPNKPALNWKTYNNFRSGDLSPPDGLKAPDLTLDVASPCQLECEDDKLLVWVHLGNEGASPATAGATIELVAIADGLPMTKLSLEVPQSIDPGTYTDAFAFELPGQPFDSIEVTVITKEQECDTNNNFVALPGPFCKNPG